VNGYHMLPLANLVGNPGLAGITIRIKGSGATDPIIHPEVPSQTTIPRGVAGVRSALEKGPSLAVGSHSITVIDRRLSCTCLVTRRIKPCFHSKRLSVRWVER